MKEFGLKSYLCSSKIKWYRQIGFRSTLTLWSREVRKRLMKAKRPGTSMSWSSEPYRNGLITPTKKMGKTPSLTKTRIGSSEWKYTSHVKTNQIQHLSRMKTSHTFWWASLIFKKDNSFVKILCSKLWTIINKTKTSPKFSSAPLGKLITWKLLKMIQKCS